MALVRSTDPQLQHHEHVVTPGVSWQPDQVMGGSRIPVVNQYPLSPR